MQVLLVVRYMIGPLVLDKGFNLINELITAYNCCDNPKDLSTKMLNEENNT